jgi:protein-S-isoprenylcysteine O-methyltransferase Ste14
VRRGAAAVGSSLFLAVAPGMMGVALPWAITRWRFESPTEHLVVTGIYRHVRNPMYIAVTGVIVGQALLFGQLWLLAYAAAFLAVTVSFVHFYEEPTLAAQFAADYPAYREGVPGWLPRLTPWSASKSSAAVPSTEPPS